ncbi:serine hydrolase-domain-containing protein [Hypoxylon fragiforme]|uniref:serine hydrolase-domain-containing protein n=1 Tax=Hypoxylon fragiforme TaxID=63214 RepID=UPI0020C6D8FD|nr:serine hydrolase-domain-containing protein [Hypoxylon fragiforme]KAI2606021.1 serine hydrolase-domain-containing protein [Hypoxylon fragiforme]
MRFLCLPGAYGSAKNFGVQLGPFAKHMEDRGLATFAFTQGAHEVEPPLGWENYFGSRPLYRFIDGTANNSSGDAFEVIRRVRHIPRGLSPEATLRLFKPTEPVQKYDWKNFRDSLDSLLQQIDDDPEIDGLIGYSEGAMMAASICAEENRRWEEMGVPRRIKFAIFFAGTPALVAEKDSSSSSSNNNNNCPNFTTKLADEHGTSIHIPTFHVFGSNDPLVYSSIALYNTCDPDLAQLYDHGLGHLVPRDADNVEQLGDTLSDVITRINKEKTAAAALASKEQQQQQQPSRVQTPVNQFTDEYDVATNTASSSSSSSASSASEAGSMGESDLDSQSSTGAASEDGVNVKKLSVMV